MEIEEEIAAFAESEIWVECDLCGRAYAGPGLNDVMVARKSDNVCVHCLRSGIGNGDWERGEKREQAAAW